MIKPAFLKRQSEKSLQEKRTSPFLRRLVFQVVDAAARGHYADAYPTKCFQCSAAIATLLDGFGIRSRMMAGAVCIAETSEGEMPRWGGFWDQDHHVWLMTGFGELVDLSIGVLHRHPASSRADGHPNPPLWWTDPGVWPPIIRYLPDTEVHRLADPAERADLDRFRSRAIDDLGALTADGTVEDISFGPILDGMATLDGLTQAGNPWARRAYAIQRHRVPHPPWIRRREEELMEAWRQRRPASSHLRQVPGVLETK